MLSVVVMFSSAFGIQLRGKRGDCSCFTAHTVINLTDSFVKKICDVLIEPRVSIKGKFFISYTNTGSNTDRISSGPHEFVGSCGNEM